MSGSAVYRTVLVQKYYGDLYTERLSGPLAAAAIPQGSLDSSKQGIIDKLTSTTTDDIVNVLVVCDDGVAEDLSGMVMRDLITGWVRTGGLLITIGERKMAARLSAWFDRPSWNMDGDFYRRTTFHRNNDHFSASAVVDIPSSINVKACMMAGVSADESLYSTDEAAVSHSLVPSMARVPLPAGESAVVLARYGEGVVCFIGDVNAQAETVSLIVKVIKAYARDDFTRPARPVPPAPAPGCGHCGNATAQLRCSGCGVVVYCNRECQKAAWKAGHKATCGGR